MSNPILHQVEKGKAQIMHWGATRLEQVQARRQELRQRGEEVIDQGRTRVRVVEGTVLEQVAGLLSKASDTLGPRASFLKQGEEAISELLVNVRAESPETLPIEGFDELSIRKLTPHLEGLDELSLRTVRAYEIKHKNRVTLLRAIDDLLDHDTQGAKAN